MALFTGTRTTNFRHGVFAEERSALPVVTAQGTGTVGLVGQFPWGPDDKVIQPEDSADRLRIIAPLGMDRTGSGFMCQLGKPWPDLRLVRVLGSAAAKASAALLNATPATAVTVTALYKGTAGNSLVAVVSAASDGDANHFNLTVSVTNADGSTEERFENINFSGTGADSVVDCSKCTLIGAVTKVLSGRPVNGTYTFSGGTNGTINSGRYLGTPEAADFGLALFEGDPEVDIVFTDDPGNSDRAAVNAGLKAHALLMTDRVVVLNGDAGLTASAARSAAALNQTQFAAFVYPWHYQRDLSGVERLVAPAAAMACVMANLPPSTSPAWKDQSVRDLLSYITRLEFSLGGSAIGANTLAGVCTLIKEVDGGHTFEAAINTAAPTAPNKKNLTRTRTGIFLAKSLQVALRSEVDAPNVPKVQQDVLFAIQNFMNNIRDNVNKDPKTLVHVVEWGFGDLKAFNPAASIAAGEFTVPLEVQTSAGMEKIYLSLNYGESVTVSLAA